MFTLIPYFLEYIFTDTYHQKSQPSDKGSIFPCCNAISLKFRAKRGGSLATMRPGGNTTTEFFACRSESHNFICNCGTRVRFESIRKLADGEATERALEED